MALVGNAAAAAVLVAIGVVIWRGWREQREYEAMDEFDRAREALRPR